MNAADHLWTNPENQDDDNPSLVRLGRDGLFLARIPTEELDGAAGALASGESILGRTIPLKSIRRVSGTVGEPGLNIVIRRDDGGRQAIDIGMRDPIQRDEFLDALEARLGNDWERVNRRTGRVKDALWPFGIMIVVGLITWFMHWEAERLEAGNVPKVRGRARSRIVRQLIHWVAGALGPTGVLVVGGLLIVVCLVWLFAVISHPVERIVLLPRFEMENDD